MEIDPKFYPAVGSVIAAAIAGAIALVSLVISKENKLSDFRQSWIDSLRVEVADLLSNILMIKKLVEDEESDVEKKDLFQALQIADRSLMLIRLRLNENEPDSMRLLETIDKIENLSNGSSFPYEVVQKLERELISHSKQVLKTEWERVKSGEPIFKILKFSVPIFVITFAISVICSLNPTN